MENESSIKQMINSSMEQIRSLIDADTVVGKPISTPSGTVILPISKISIGLASGGFDIPGKKKDAAKNFGGGSGTGLTVVPLGFLTIYGDGHVEMLPMVQEKSTTVEQIADLIQQAPDVISRVKSAILGLRDDEEELDDEEARVQAELDAALAAEAEDPYADLSLKELKKLRRAEEKAAKKAAKEAARNA